LNGVSMGTVFAAICFGQPNSNLTSCCI